LEAPANDRWRTVARGAERVVLARTDPDVTATRAAYVLPADASVDDEAFVRATESGLEVEVLGAGYPAASASPL
jgi:hypothetical protein